MTKASLSTFWWRPRSDEKAIGWTGKAYDRHTKTKNHWRIDVELGIPHRSSLTHSENLLL